MTPLPIIGRDAILKKTGVQLAPGDGIPVLTSDAYAGMLREARNRPTPASLPQMPRQQRRAAARSAQKGRAVLMVRP